MKKRSGNRKRFVKVAAGLMAGLMLTAALPVYAQQAAEQDAEAVNAMSLIGKYDSADTATIVAVDTEKQLIRFFNHDRGRTYTLSYDNTSMIFDASVNALSARLLEPGMIVNLTFLKSSKHLNSLVISKDAFSYEDVSDYDLSAGFDTARVFGKFYKLTPMTLVLAGGEQIALSGILPADTINVRGVGDEIYAITIAKGHGYISLSSDRVGDIDLVGGWLELGSSYIRRITPGMFATVPEGTYELRIEGEGFDFTDEVTIMRNRETVVDVSQISSSNARVGTVIFRTTPEDAAVYVDGERAQNGVEQHYSIGIHPLRVEAEGHTTMNAYLKVGRQQATINLNLGQSSASAASTAASTAATAASTASAYGTTNAASYASSIYGGETWGSNTGASMTGIYTTPAPTGATGATGGATGSTGSTTASTTGTGTSSNNASSEFSNPTGGTWSNAGTGAGNDATNAATAATNSGAGSGASSGTGNTGSGTGQTQGASGDNTGSGAGRTQGASGDNTGSGTGQSQGASGGNTGSGTGQTQGSGTGQSSGGGATGNSGAAHSGWVETDPERNDSGGNGAGGWIETDPDRTGGNLWVETDPDRQPVNGRRVTIANPQGAQLYLDGTYIGTTPTYFEKVPGLHTVTLRMNGYQPQTYTISVDNRDENRTYNFPALIAE